jgi:hypothetical protein
MNEWIRSLASVSRLEGLDRASRLVIVIPMDKVRTGARVLWKKPVGRECRDGGKLFEN